MSDAFFPWKLYINNIFAGDEANSVEDVRKILSRVGLKLVAQAATLRTITTKVSRSTVRMEVSFKTFSCSCFYGIFCLLF